MNKSIEATLIYTSTMDEVMNDVDVKYEENFIPYADFSLNENPNDTIQDMFHFEVETAIDTGNINVIRKAISDYGDLLDNSYIAWANRIMIEMLEEQMEDIELK
tara:strand:- start:271 stop:582 length:312 start_codon:yes stop_codon:yes gene_type:complete